MLPTFDHFGRTFHISAGLGLAATFDRKRGVLKFHYHEGGIWWLMEAGTNWTFPVADRRG